MRIVLAISSLVPGGAQRVMTLLAGEQEAAAFDTELLVQHITRFCLAALGLEKSLREVQS